MTSSFSLVSSPMCTELSPTQAVFLLLGDVDHNLFTGKSFGEGPPLGLPSRVLRDAHQSLRVLTLVHLLGGLPFVEEP